MTTVAAGLAEYLTGVLAGIQPLRPLSMALLDAHRQVLAEDVRAPSALPAFDAAAVDGYAVRSDDLLDATAVDPVRLAVVGDLRAASWQAVRVSPGACYAIEAGAPLPAGADAVVAASITDGGIAAVHVRRPPAPGGGVRHVGTEVGIDELVGAEGTRLDAGLLALLVATGVGTVAVRPRPRVAVAATGDELVDAGLVTGPGRVVDTNSYAITAAAREAGAQALRLGVAPDEPEALRGLLEDHAPRADLVVITGGTGNGPGDVVRRLFEHGGIEFVDLPLHPAAAFGFGTAGLGTPVACLPGDPAGALVAFEVLVRPVIQRLAGSDQPFRPSVKASLGETVRSPAGLREFRPAYVTERRGGGYIAQPLAGGAHLLTGYAAANGLLVLGERVANAPAGSTVDVLLFDRTR